MFLSYFLASVQLFLKFIGNGNAPNQKIINTARIIFSVLSLIFFTNHKLFRKIIMLRIKKSDPEFTKCGWVHGKIIFSLSIYENYTENYTMIYVNGMFV